MTKAARGAVYTIAAWALRLALVAYGILVVTIRYPALVFGLVRSKTGTLSPPVLAHALGNLMIICLW